MESQLQKTVNRPTRAQKPKLLGALAGNPGGVRGVRCCAGWKRRLHTRSVYTDGGVHLDTAAVPAEERIWHYRDPAAEMLRLAGESRFGEIGDQFLGLAAGWVLLAVEPERQRVES